MRPSDLDPARWRKIDAVLGAALEAAPGDRDGVLDRACGDDLDLRAEVEALLKAHAGARARRFDPPPPELLQEAVTAQVLEGRRVGPFRLLREIGRGGMGVVYLAQDTRLGRDVALKVLPPWLGAGPDARLRFETEARAVSALDHPNIATLYEIDETEEGQLYMVFAFYAGETLAARIARGPLPPDEATQVAIDIAEGLGAAHRNGVIHCDVKPSNVLLTDDGGGAKLLDFGVAKVAGEDQTGDGVRLGTVAYMSPEQIGPHPVDPRADLWALGVVLHEMLTGTHPFRATDPLSTIRAIVDEEPQPLAGAGQSLPAGLVRVVDKLLCKDPDGRYRGTGDLLADLRAWLAGDAPPVVTREPPPSPPQAVRRLAILPLANLTGSPTQAHVVHGIHDGLIAELGKIRSLGVVSRTSVMPFRNTEMQLPVLARLLDVEAILEGSVSRSGDDLVITAQLIAVSPERHLWAGTYRRALETVVDVAAEVARSIAAELSIPLTPSEESRLGTPRRVEPGAYDAYATGLLYLERRSPEGHELAQQHLRRAIQLDPTFAPAYAMLAEACGSAAFFGLARPAEAVPLVRSLLDKALALDPGLPDAHTILGALRIFGDWDARGAEAALRQAIALNPSFAYAHFLLADVLAVQGRFTEALASAERHRTLEPFVPFSAFGPVIVLASMRDFDRAIARAEPAVEFFTDFWQGPWLLAQAYLGKAMHGQAIVQAEAAAELSGRTPMALGALGLAYAAHGRTDAATAVLSELEARAGSAYVGATNFAMIHVGLGNRERAFEWLERAFRERDMALSHAGYDVFWDPLRSDPRFTGLLRRIRLAPQVTAAGTSIPDPERGQRPPRSEAS